jgi:uncharacterized protein (DUF2235 family)
MANIIFLADGTWNGPGQPDDEPQTTNVFKAFGLLAGEDDLGTIALAKEQERTLTDGNSVGQVAKYLHGVGDSSNPILRLFGGTFGTGVIARIVRGYTFISRNWSEGDRIFIVGFSRGAYTARSLAGLIVGQGLLSKEDCEDKEQAYRYGAAVWARHREERPEPDALKRALGSVMSHLPSFLDPQSARAATPPHPLRQASVDCVAVWDTVGALGIPLYDGVDQRMDVFQFCDCKLSGAVRKGYHAVAYEEQRADFTPTLWDAREGITQVLFAGAHADVGGGYPLSRDESQLSHVSLAWMCEQLAAEGVLFKREASELYPGSPFGPSHQPWTQSPWNFGKHAYRGGDEFLGLPHHPSLMERVNSGAAYTVYPSERLERPRAA